LELELDGLSISDTLVKTGAVSYNKKQQGSPVSDIPSKHYLSLLAILFVINPCTPQSSTPSPWHIKNSYIVMLKPDVSSSVLQNHLKFLTAAYESDPLQLDGDVKSGIRHMLGRDYTGMFTYGVVDKIREMLEVDSDYVEKDQIVRMYTPVDT
jgi:hypothetical protein